MNYRFIESIEAISAEDWNAVAGINYPFLRYEFLHALEASGSVSKKSGWQPQHLLIEEGRQIIAVLPLYIKTHSFGEYVFDQSWADAYARHGLHYYPKLLAAIPFTPAAGPRLAHQCADHQKLMVTVKSALNKKAESIGASGWHCLFPPQDELAHWQAIDGEVRLGCQYYWYNNQYGDFSDFMAALTSKRRYSLKKERERVAEKGIRLERLTGDDITPAHWQRFYYFYQMTYLKYSGHRGYLTADFFARLHQSLREHLMLVFAYEGEEAIAGSLNFFSADTLYGRYWGAIKEVDFLHFEACYYQGIEFCIERGLQRFDPGAQGEHKIPRGFQPTLTYSLHWIRHAGFRHAIQKFLHEEADAVKRYQMEASKALPFK